MTHYGNPSVESENIVKKIYEELDMKDEWFEHLEKSLTEAQELVDQMPERSPKQAFDFILQKLLINRESDLKRR